MIQYLPFIGDMVSSFFGNKEKRDQYTADNQTAVYKQFAQEFGHAKTWWDSLIDGINRLPRPVMTFGIIAMFIYCWADPVGFSAGAQALQLMPKEGWYVLGIVVGFWFAGKLPKDFGKYSNKETSAQVIENIKKIRGIETNQNSDPHDVVDWNDRKENRYNTND